MQDDVPTGGATVPDSPTAPRDPLLDEWMDRDELAGALGVKPDTLARWQSQRIGPPACKVGRRTLYRRDAVREWLRTREVGPVEPRRKRAS